MPMAHMISKQQHTIMRQRAGLHDLKVRCPLTYSPCSLSQVHTVRVEFKCKVHCKWLHGHGIMGKEHIPCHRPVLDNVHSLEPVCRDTF